MVETQRQGETVAIDDITFSEGCSIARGKNTWFSGARSFYIVFSLD